MFYDEIYISIKLLCGIFQFMLISYYIHFLCPSLNMWSWYVFGVVYDSHPTHSPPPLSHPSNPFLLIVCLFYTKLMGEREQKRPKYIGSIYEY